MKKKIVMTSDTHGIVEIKSLLEDYSGDILIHAGDHNAVRPWHTSEMIDTVSESVEEIKECKDKFNHIIINAGNHETGFDKKHCYFIDKEDKQALATSDELKQLEDLIISPKIITIDGINIFVTPTSPKFGDWAFKEEEYEDYIKDVINRVDKIDIIVSHGPPYGYGDKTEEGELTGSHLMNEIIEKFKPKLFVCGHIHEGYGVYEHSNGVTRVVNASLLNRRYKPTNEPITMEIEF